MKRILYILSILFILVNYGHTTEFIEPLSMYKTNYFATGDSKDDQVKFQLSVKYNLLWPFNSGIYFGYTQLSYWRIYDSSSPFKDTNFQPEFFYKFESGNNVFDNYTIPFVDYIQICPIYHRSNGQPAGPNDRSENKFYYAMQVSAGTVYNFGARVKVFGYYNVGDGNRDINKYHKYYEGAVFFKNMSRKVTRLERESIEISWGGNPFGNGWVQGEFSVRILTSYIQPKLFIQGFYGYDEFMMNYSTKTKAVRIGFSL